MYNITIIILNKLSTVKKILTTTAKDLTGIEVRCKSHIPDYEAAEWPIPKLMEDGSGGFTRNTIHSVTGDRLFISVTKKVAVK